MSAVAPAAKGIAFSATATPPPVAAAAAVATSSTTVVPGRGALFAALTDALAGALGSVVAVAVFYPIDVAKTRAQASSSTSPLPSSDYAGETRDAASRRGSSKGVAGGREAGWLRSRTLSALVSLVRNEGVSRLYEGIEAKALQSLLGSFIYFYAYAFIKVRRGLLLLLLLLLSKESADRGKPDAYHAQAGFCKSAICWCSLTLLSRLGRQMALWVVGCACIGVDAVRT